MESLLPSMWMAWRRVYGWKLPEVWREAEARAYLLSILAAFSAIASAISESLAVPFRS